MMAREVKEEEVYEDLSMMLQMIKKKLSVLIRHPHIE
jgi:Icc-related predicted phosphoesterase